MLTRLEAGLIGISWLTAAGLASVDAKAWDRLSASALVDNPFYARQYVLAGLETIDRHTGLSALALHSAEGTLVGLLPFRKRFGLPVAVAASNLYQFSSAPLIARESARETVAALLDAMAQRLIPRIWVFAHVDQNSELMTLIDELAPARGLVRIGVNTYPRAYLTRKAGTFAAHQRTVYSKSRAKSINRVLRQLQDMGRLELEQVTEPKAVRARLEDFLSLENSGWKGKSGTALAASGQDADFARLAFGGMPGREGLTQVHTLLLDGRPIASNLTILAGSTAFTPKIAYDESLRKLSPGIVRAHLMIEAFFDHAAYTSMDSASTNANSNLLGMWDSERTFGTTVLGPDDWRTRLVARAITDYARLKQFAKTILRRA